MNNKEYIKGSIFVILSAIIFGIMPLAATIFYSNGGNPFMLVFLRCFLSSISLYILLKINRINLNFNEIKKRIKVLIPVSIMYGLTPAMLYLSYRYISTGTATILHFTYPIFVLIIITIMQKSLPSPLILISIALTLFGIIFLNMDAKVSFSNKFIIGVILAVVSGLTYAIYIVGYSETCLKKINVLEISFLLNILSTVYLLVLTIILKRFTINFGITGLGAAIFLGFGCSTFATILFQKGTKKIGAEKGALLSTLEPITSLIIGILVFSESIGTLPMIGVTLIILGVILTLKDKK